MGLLRILLALSVVLSHLGVPIEYRLVNGDTAVQAFYVISGFYMALILTGKYRDACIFLSNRFLRLFPVYWIVLAATAAFSLLLLLAGRDAGYPGFGAAVQAGRSVTPAAALYIGFTNVFILGQDLSLYLQLGHDGLAFATRYVDGAQRLYLFELVPQAWSISMELIFYLAAAWIVRWRVRRLWLLVAAAVTLRLWLFAHGLDYDPWRYRFLPAEFGLFVLGVIVFKISAGRWPAVLAATWAWQLAALVALVLTFGWMPGDLTKQVIVYALIAVSLPGVFAGTQHSRLDRYLGELSYPIYLSHLLVISVVERLRLGVTGTRVVSIALTIACSALLYTCVQSPIDRFRAARARGRVAPATTA